MPVTAILLAVYIATLAPTVTYWDSGEFLSAIRTLGIPHPPGTPLYILLGNVWSSALGGLLGFAYSVNLLSAVCTAVACGVMAQLMMRWTGRRWAAIAGGILSGLMSSVWLNANETEVYSPALLVSVLLIAIAEQARSTRDTRWYLLLAYLSGLGWSLQLSALVAAPAAIYLAFFARPDSDILHGEVAEDPTASNRQSLLELLPMMGLVALIGASAVLFMLVRANHDPAINQGNPATWQAFLDVLSRKQYQPVAMLPRQAPLYLQLGNLFEYADWQIALGLAPDAPPSLVRTPFTILYGALGVAGCVWHSRTHKPSWQTMMVLFVTATVGVIAYLNMKASPSYGGHFLAATAKHEARERDYFFALAFLCWGLWAGAGAVRTAARFGTLARFAGFAIAVLPAAFNWKGVDRRIPAAGVAARDSAVSILRRAPRNAVVFAIGDNDTYPVWYMQQVERMRRDVTPVTLPLLGAKWYRQELARRHSLLTREYVEQWRGLGATYSALCVRGRALGRPVVTSEFKDGPAVPPSCR